MKKILISSFLFFCLYACNNGDKKGSPDSENAIDAARNFIQSGLNGDYRKARNYMLQDSASISRMDMIERVRLAPDEKKGLAGSTINIHKVDKLNDSTTIVIYSNSFKNNWDTLRIKKIEDKWLVDFNYLFDHDTDTLAPLPALKTDSLEK